MAGAAVKRGLRAAAHYGVRARAGGIAGRDGAGGVVRPPVGPHALRRGGHHGAVRLPHRGLRVRRRAVRRRRRGAARHAGRVHARRQRRARLLRRQPRRRLQPGHARHASQHHDKQQHQRRRSGEVRGDGVLGGAERRVPRGPAGGGGDRGRGGVPERVRGVRGRAVLLQRRVREPQRLPAVGLLGVLQGRVPARIQLRLRRRHIHLHLRRWRHRLRRHLLPRGAHQRQVDGAEPAGRRAAADERHHGLLRPRRRGHQRAAAQLQQRRLPRRRRSELPRLRRSRGRCSLVTSLSALRAPRVRRHSLASLPAEQYLTGRDS